MLIAFSGLPGVGKTTLARAFAREIGAVYLRIDTIELAIDASGFVGDMGPMGYMVAYGVAEDNLMLGRTVIADSVNPIAVTRHAWHAVAQRSGVQCVDIEVICSDVNVHRERVEVRLAREDVPGMPDWAAVVSREYEPWTTGVVRVDTVKGSHEEHLALLNRAVTS